MTLLKCAKRRNANCAACWQRSKRPCNHREMRELRRRAAVTARPLPRSPGLSPETETEWPGHLLQHFQRSRTSSFAGGAFAKPLRRRASAPARYRHDGHSFVVPSASRLATTAAAPPPYRERQGRQTRPLRDSQPRWDARCRRMRTAASAIGFRHRLRHRSSSDRSR